MRGCSRSLPQRALRVARRHRPPSLRHISFGREMFCSLYPLPIVSLHSTPPIVGRWARPHIYSEIYGPRKLDKGRREGGRKRVGGLLNLTFLRGLRGNQFLPSQCRIHRVSKVSKRRKCSYLGGQNRICLPPLDMQGDVPTRRNPPVLLLEQQHPTSNGITV